MKSVRQCALHAAQLSHAFKLTWRDVVMVGQMFGDVVIHLKPAAFIRIARDLNIMRNKFHVSHDDEHLHVSFQHRSAMWTTVVDRSDEQWKIMHDCMHLSNDQKALPAPALPAPGSSSPRPKLVPRPDVPKRIGSTDRAARKRQRLIAIVNDASTGEHEHDTAKQQLAKLKRQQS